MAHVDVLAFHHVERERAGGDVGQNALEPSCNGFGIGGRDDALGGQHVSMGDRAGDVLGVESLIHGSDAPKRWVKASAPSVNLPDHSAIVSPR